jgi:flagellin
MTRQAVRNINDGISLLKVAEARLTQQGALLDRLQELATQASSGSFTNTQRRALQAEYTQLIVEFGRLGDSLSFNRINPLLAGRGSSGAAYGV